MSLPLSEVIRVATEASALSVEVTILTKKLATAEACIDRLRQDVSEEKSRRVGAERYLTTKPTTSQASAPSIHVVLNHSAPFFDVNALVRSSEVCLFTRELTQTGDLWRNVWQTLPEAKQRGSSSPRRSVIDSRLPRSTNYKAAVIAYHATKQRRRVEEELSIVKRGKDSLQSYCDMLRPRTVKWTISQEKLCRCARGSSIVSPLFAVGGMPGCSLIFYPAGYSSGGSGERCALYISSLKPLRAKVWIGTSASFDINHVFGKNAKTKNWGFDEIERSYLDQTASLDIVVEFFEVFEACQPPYTFIES